MTHRKAEASEVRRWDGDIAAANDLDRFRDWVVWGTGGAPPPDIRDGLTDDPVAEGFAREADDEWDDLPEEERWVAVVRAEEDDVDALVEEAQDVRGYAPYLAAASPQSAPPAPDEEDDMQAPLRDDVAPRRKVEQPRPT